MGNEVNELPAGKCPILDKECIAEQCNFFTQVSLPMSSPLVGVPQTGELRGCTAQVIPFLLGALLAAQARPKMPVRRHNS